MNSLIVPSALIPPSLRVTQRTPQARHGVTLRRRILKRLADEGPATAAEIADNLNMNVLSIYKHIRFLYKDSLHVSHWNRRYGVRGPVGWTAVFSPGKQPDAPYPEPVESRTVGKRKPAMQHTWGITPVSPPGGPSPSR